MLRLILTTFIAIFLLLPSPSHAKDKWQRVRKEAQREAIYRSSLRHETLEILRQRRIRQDILDEIKRDRGDRNVYRNKGK